MAEFNYEEYADIVFAYGLANGNTRAAQRMYRELHPDRRVPHHNTFSSTFRRLRETGNLASREPRVNARNLPVFVDEDILRAFDNDPTTSVRRVARDLGLSVWKVWSVINADGRHPFHYTQVQGGWYILRDWSEPNSDEDLLLLKLHVDYGVSPFFKISVEPNPNMPGHNVIRISPSGLGLPDKEYYYRDEDDRIMTAYKEYIRDVVIYLSTARNDATKFGNDIFSYEKRIAEVTPDTVSLQNPITTFNAISISELKETNLIPFFDILQAMYPESNISENTEVVVTSMEYLGQIAQIIATTDRKSMNGYLIWTLLRKYIPFVSSKYTSAVDTFNSELFGIQKTLGRWEICSRLVRRYMGLATTNLMETNNPITERTAQLVNNMFSSIVTVVRRKIFTLRKTELLYNHLKSKLSNLRLQIGVPKNLTTDKYLKSYYSTLRIIKSNFFDSVRSSIELQRKLEARRLLKSPAEDSILAYALPEIPRVAYAPSEHAIVVPRALLVEPFFENNFPSAIVYGRLGVEIAEAVLSSILPYNSLWTADKKILSPFHTTANESVRSVQDVTKCLSDYILNLNLAIPAVTANETALKTLKHLSAIEAANEALATTVEKTEHIHQPALEEYESSALFFLAYAQVASGVDAATRLCGLLRMQFQQKTPMPKHPISI